MARALVLTAVTGSLVGKRYTLTGRTSTIGSASGCDVVLFDRMVAPRHAEVRQVLERWFIVPVAPGAQVYVNSQPVSGQARLNDGDAITFGTITFAIALTEVDEQSIGALPGSSGVPRVGDYLVRRGVLSQSQLGIALQRQSELSRQGRRLNLGDVLQELGFATRSQVEQAVADQRRDFSERFHD